MVSTLYGVSDYDPNSSEVLMTRIVALAYLLVALAAILWLTFGDPHAFDPRTPAVVIFGPDFDSLRGGSSVR